MIGPKLTTVARADDERGVASLWVGDHVIFPRTTTGNYPGGCFPHSPDKPYLEPVISLTGAEMCTTHPARTDNVVEIDSAQRGAMLLAAAAAARATTWGDVFR